MTRSAEVTPETRHWMSSGQRRLTIVAAIAAVAISATTSYATTHRLCSHPGELVTASTSVRSNARVGWAHQAIAHISSRAPAAVTASIGLRSRCSSPAEANRRACGAPSRAAVRSGRTFDVSSLRFTASGTDPRTTGHVTRASDLRGPFRLRFRWATARDAKGANVAELTNLESKLGEVMGLAMAAQAATEKVTRLAEDDQDARGLVAKLEQMHN